MWARKPLDWLKFLSHNLQLYGLSPVWIWMTKDTNIKFLFNKCKSNERTRACAVKSPDNAKVFGHHLHSYGRSPVWVPVNGSKQSIFKSQAQDENVCGSSSTYANVHSDAFCAEIVVHKDYTCSFVRRYVFGYVRANRLRWRIHVDKICIYVDDYWHGFSCAVSIYSTMWRSDCISGIQNALIPYEWSYDCSTPFLDRMPDHKSNIWMPLHLERNGRIAESMFVP